MTNLDLFLKKHIPNNNICTHTRIGNSNYGVYGGKYNISDEDRMTFYKLYHKKIFVDNKWEYLTEQPYRDGFPILVDIDLKYEKEIEERQHNEEHIIDIIYVYLDKLKEILKIRENTEFPIFVFEKPNVNTLSDITKDGIHIVIGITMDVTLQLILRERVLDAIKEILNDIPHINIIDEIIDIHVSRGGLWQMYGSRKPGHEAYKLVHYYNIEWQDNKWSDLEEIALSNCDTLDLLLMVSARKKDNISYEIKDDIKDLYDKKKSKWTNNKIIHKSKVQNSCFGFVDYSKITNSAELKAAITDILDNLDDDEYYIREIYLFTMLLSEKYYNNYDNWLRVGFALHNTDKKIFLIWMLFSSQSNKFNYQSITSYWETWLGMREEGLTERSIMYWAKDCDPAGYNKIHNETLNFYIDKSIDRHTDHNMALVLYKMFEGKFICASIKNKVWYEFKKHKWEEVDSGTTLRNHITKKVSGLYDKRVVLMKNQLTAGVQGADHEEIYKSLNTKINTALQIIMKMGNVDGKNRIMREAQELFYNKQFFEKLDANPYLIHFTNGVIDFSAETYDKIFRNGKPEDFISLSTKHAYVKFNKKNAEHVKNKKEIDLFFNQLFTNIDLRRYMLEHLASTLIGTNENETFNIYNGVGRNGKSKLVDLMSKVLGELKGVVPLSLVTRKREGSGKASPELARLRGVRYAVMQEPSKNDKINEGQMKELTGGDSIQARALFRDPIEFKPQFKLAVCTNSLFDVTSNDDGTWRRIRVCEFLSKFCLNPSKNIKDKEFKGITPSKLLAKFDKWLEVFTAMLVEIAYNTQGKVDDCEMVLAASKKYRGSQDYMGKFFDENIEKYEMHDGDTPMKWSRTWTVFKQWWNYCGYADRQLPKHSEFKNFMEGRLGLYPKRGWRNYRILQPDY